MVTVRLRDGEVTLCMRGDSKNWYAGFRLARRGRLQESLKARNKAWRRKEPSSVTMTFPLAGMSGAAT